MHHNCVHLSEMSNERNCNDHLLGYFPYSLTLNDQRTNRLLYQLTWIKCV